jgi:hypothetical protein
VCKGGEHGGSGPQTDKHLPESPVTGKFFLMTTFWIAFYESYLSTEEGLKFNNIQLCTKLPAKKANMPTVR